MASSELIYKLTHVQEDTINKECYGSSRIQQSKYIFMSKQHKCNTIGKESQRECKKENKAHQHQILLY